MLKLVTSPAFTITGRSKVLGDQRGGTMWHLMVLMVEILGESGPQSVQQVQEKLSGMLGFKVKRRIVNQALRKTSPEPVVTG